MNYHTFDRLPERLTISFPLWLIYGTKGENSPYYDIDKAIREHAERGFNCIRIDSGAGLIHDLDGNLRQPFNIGDMFGEYEKIPRQEHIIGDGGPCDLLSRLIETFECAKKYGIYVILSQWYYLHTYWYHKADDPVADELFSIPLEERFDAFGKFWHYILLELEKRNLDSQIAFVEIFNEVNEHPYYCGERDWGANKNVTNEEAAMFGKQHTEVINFLQKEHPNLIFAYDTAGPCQVKETLPGNTYVYNFHAYYLWGIYESVFAEHREWFRNEITPQDVMNTRKSRRPVDYGWYERVAKHNDINPMCLPEIDKALEEKLKASCDEYKGICKAMLDDAIRLCGGRKLVCGEGVSYIASKNILWEEHSEEYWNLVKYGLNLYKKAGVWGTVIRTCCGPEDPCWTLCKDKLLELNRFFLED